MKWNKVEQNELKGNKDAENYNFISCFEHILDEKGRLILPSKFRKIIKEKEIKNFYITSGLDSCLAMYPEEEWRKILKKAESVLSFSKKDSRSFLRKLFSEAVEVSIDGQGRINLNGSLKKHARIDKEIIFVGMNNFVEIWSKEIWVKYMEKTSQSYEEVAESLTNLGL